MLPPSRQRNLVSRLPASRNTRTRRANWPSVVPA
ncbi:hypothetical protein APX70_200591 [Pseudomonas syringae pv. maculicola]|uniref:Uncharacterized protein n=1 Tax=Pseudomonas syringae pv. maculicola TaxID=59511 RepID=A0A3M2UEL4_PSEYM|nr:hypothetical protein APX70_200591 [Pseudomonas syringae pv. maculicola]